MFDNKDGLVSDIFHTLNEYYRTKCDIYCDNILKKHSLKVVRNFSQMYLRLRALDLAELKTIKSELIDGEIKLGI